MNLGETLKNRRLRADRISTHLTPKIVTSQWSCTTSLEKVKTRGGRFLFFITIHVRKITFCYGLAPYSKRFSHLTGSTLSSE